MSITLKQLAQEIDGNFSGHYEVLALDFVLVLHYLDKTNYSYIVHPTNHFQKYITDELIRLNKIKENNIVYLLSKKPDVIICNTMSIDAGGKVINTDPGDYGGMLKKKVIIFVILIIFKIIFNLIHLCIEQIQI